MTHDNNNFKCVFYIHSTWNTVLEKNIEHQNKHTPPIQLCTSERMQQMFNLAMIGIKTTTQQQQKQHNQLPEKKQNKKNPGSNPIRTGSLANVPYY